MMLKKIVFLAGVLLSGIVYAQNQVAIFAGGCFWCMQADFDKVSGVVSTTAGYDGGLSVNPSYEQVSSGETNYAESVQVIFDPAKVSYSQLLNYFFHHIDPTVKDAQFCDRGKQYRSAIFYLNVTQKKQALSCIATIKKQLPMIYTEVTPSTHFYDAESYHQKYYKKNPVRYHYYRWNCGRDARIKEVWHE